MTGPEPAEHWFRDEHGVEVFYRRWSGAGSRGPKPRGVVLISHGASEHSGRYARFAGALVAAGFVVYAPDHRGHGRTATHTGVGRLGPPGGAALIDDLHQLATAAVAENPGLPLAVFGHSMGALLALAYATRHPAGLGALVLCGFPASAAGIATFADQLRQAADAGLSDEPAPSLAGLNEAFEPARTPFDWLSRDETEVDRYLADAFCGDQHPLTFGYLAGLFEVGVPALETDAGRVIKCPVLLIAGDRDPAAGMGDNVRELGGILDAAGVATTSRLYPDARHELLNEVNRDEVTADVVEWLRSQLPSHDK